MDLSPIEQWTREMLEAEARRRGIKSPEFRTRGDLMRLILRHQYGDRLAAGRERFARGKRTFDDARELLGTAVGAALSSLPEPVSALLRMRGGHALPREEPPSARRTHVVPESDAPPKADQAREQHASETVHASVTDSAPVMDSAPVTDSTPVTDSAPVTDAPVADAPVTDSAPVTDAPVTDSAPVTSAPVTDAPVTDSAPTADLAQASDAPAIPQPAWPQPPPPIREANTQTFRQEPIRTRSMAQLLASQGHRERALAIYEELCAQNSEDQDLRAEADRLRAGRAPDAPALPRPSARPPELPARDDRIECTRLDSDQSGGLRLRWQITEDGRRRAQAVLGRDGELAVRLVTIRPDPERVVCSEITEHGPVHPHGEWVADAQSMEGTSRCFATIGLREGHRFVSIAHARRGD